MYWGGECLFTQFQYYFVVLIIVIVMLHVTNGGSWTRAFISRFVVISFFVFSLNSQALASGKHVLVEYPVALSSAAARALYTRAADQGNCWFPKSTTDFINKEDQASVCGSVCLSVLSLLITFI